MSGAFTSAGSTIFISAGKPASPVAPAPADQYTAAAYAALTYVEIGDVSEIGEFGREYNLVTFNPLAKRRTVKRKGSFNDGTISIQMARVPSDAGQTILTEAVDDDDSYSIKILLQDGTIFYTSAQILSYTTNIGGVDQITAATVNLEIDNDILEVEPAA